MPRSMILLFERTYEGGDSMQHEDEYIGLFDSAEAVVDAIRALTGTEVPASDVLTEEGLTVSVWGGTVSVCLNLQRFEVNETLVDPVSWHGAQRPPEGFVLQTIFDYYVGGDDDRLVVAVPVGTEVPEIVLSDGINAFDDSGQSLLPTGTMVYGINGWEPFVVPVKELNDGPYSSPEFLSRWED